MKIMKIIKLSKKLPAFRISKQSLTNYPYLLIIK